MLRALRALSGGTSTLAGRVVEGSPTPEPTLDPPDFEGSVSSEGTSKSGPYSQVFLGGSGGYPRFFEGRVGGREGSERGREGSLRGQFEGRWS